MASAPMGMSSSSIADGASWLTCISLTLLEEELPSTLKKCSEDMTGTT